MRARVVLAFAAALAVGTPAVATAGPDGFYTHGSAGARYRFRASTGSRSVEPEKDQDFYQDLWVEAGYGRKIRLEVSGRLDEDIDGRGRNVFQSLDDRYDEPVHGYLYDAFLELGIVPGLERVRLGRQVVQEAATLRFDGVLFRTEEISDLAALEVYGGKPVHLYESSARDDWMGGGAVELRPWKATRARLEYIHVTDRRRFDTGRVYRDDDLLSLEVRHRLSQTVRLRGLAQTYLGRSSKLEASALFFDPGMDLRVRLRYLAVLGSFRDLSIDLGPLDGVLDRYEPYHEVTGEVKKGVMEGLWIGGGLALRELQNAGDEGPFNHEFLRLYAFAESEDLFWKGLELYGRLEHYESDRGPDRTFAASFDVTQRLSDDLSVSIGNQYDQYRFDGVTIDEREDVYTVYARGDWKVLGALRFGLGYEFTTDKEDAYHVVRTQARITW